MSKISVSDILMDNSKSCSEKERWKRTRKETRGKREKNSKKEGRKGKGKKKWKMKNEEGKLNFHLWTVMSYSQYLYIKYLQR